MQNTSVCINKSIVESCKVKLSSFEFYFILFFIFYFLVPSINAMVPLFFAVAIGIFYVFYLLINNVKETRFLIKFVFFSLLLSIFYLLLTQTQTISQSVSNYQLKRLVSKFNQMFFSFLPVVLFVRVMSRASRKQKKIFLIVSLFLFAYVILNTAIELSLNENATRNWADFSSQSDNNVGTYAFIYAVTIIIVALPSILVKFNSIKIKFLLTLIVVLLFVFLLFAQYTLALLIAVIGLLFQFSGSLKKESSKAVLWISSILFLLFMPTFFSVVADFVPSEQMANRLKEVSAFLMSGDTSGYNLSGRLTLYAQTISAFLNSPIIGNQTLGFDGHATFLTVFADIGIFGGLLFVYLFYMAKKQINQKFTKKQNKIFSPIFICIILMGLTNPIHSAQPLSFAVWFLAPLMISIFVDNKEKQ